MANSPHIAARALRTGLGAVLIFALGSTIAPAADKPWFGIDSLAKRQKFSERQRELAANPDFAPLSLQTQADEPFAAITGPSIGAYLDDILELTYATRPEGEKFWGRIAGSESEIATAEYIAERFRELGLQDVRLETVTGGEQWWPLEWQVTLLGSEEYGPDSVDIDFLSAFPALQLQGEAMATEVEADLVYVGYGQPADLAGRNVRGKIAVARASLTPDGFFQTARGYMDNIAAAGAAGILVALDSPGNHQFALEGMGGEQVPSFILGGDDGRFLVDALGAAGEDFTLRARLALETEIRDSWEGANVLGLIPGSTDEYVVVVSHLDGYFESANDNATGLASMLEIADFFANHAAEKPRRSMLFVGTSGHHEFSDGVQQFIERHQDILDRSVLVMNIEHPASTLSYFRGALKFKSFTLAGQLVTTTTHGNRSLNVSNGNPLLVEFYRRAIDRYGLVIAANRESSPPTGDAFDFYRAGNVVVQILDANIWYHSTGDRIDTISPVDLERATRVYAYVLDQIDQHDTAELKARGR